MAKLDSHSNNRYCNEYWDGYPGRLLVISCDYMILYPCIPGYWLPNTNEGCRSSPFFLKQRIDTLQVLQEMKLQKKHGHFQNHWTEKWIFQWSILSQRCQELELFYPPFLLQTLAQLTTNSMNQSSPTNTCIMTVYTNLILGFMAVFVVLGNPIRMLSSSLTLTSHPFRAFQVKYAAGCNRHQWHSIIHTGLINRDPYNSFL